MAGTLLPGCLLDRSGWSGVVDASTEDSSSSSDAFVETDAREIDAHRPDPDGGPCVGADADQDGVADVCDVCDAGDDRIDADGDRVPDACDRCPAGDDRTDADGDRIADACDVCATGDDRLDIDSDRVPDACDDWPCGPIPSIPHQASREGITVSNAYLNDGTNFAVVQAGHEVRIKFTWALTDTECRDCRTQVEIGYVPGPRLGCAFDDEPDRTVESATVEYSFQAPSTPGRYDGRFNLGLAQGCEGGRWWGGEPPPEDQTFAAICVVP